MLSSRSECTMNKPAFPQPSENPPSNHIAQPATFNSPHYLHIWPNQTHMIIAIPLPDKFFTCTLFAQDSVLATLTTHATRLSFFSRDNASVIDLNGADSLAPNSCKQTPAFSRYLHGDAAHTTVPFHGQGMNPSFESVNVLFQHLN
jgi:kynurenine 3-monooxygenase